MRAMTLGATARAHTSRARGDARLGKLGRRFGVVGVAVPDRQDVLRKAHRDHGAAHLVPDVKVFADDGEHEFLPVARRQALSGPPAIKGIAREAR